jgi:rRNA-processing protein FCF1
MEKVIFDTNFLLEKRMKNFFGKQVQLEKFSKVSKIIIPDMVMGELKERYKRDFQEEKNKFFKTLLTNILSHNADEIDIEKSIQDLIEAEAVPYEIIDLKDTSVLFDIKKLALEKRPPFVGQNGSDKGFKDAYIYFTVLEYLQEIDDKYVFFVTDDGLLKDALKEHSNIYVVKDFDEFMKKSIASFLDNYFVEKLQSEVNSSINKDSITDYWISINDNHILYIELEDIKYIVEVDSGEIIDYRDANSYKSILKGLIESTNFIDTIESIKILKSYINYFSDNDAVDLLVALVENSQIRGTVGAGSYTVDFMRALYEKKYQLLSSEIDDKIPDRIK